MLSKFKGNEKLVEEILGRTAFAEEKFEHILERILMRNNIRREIMDKFEDLEEISPKDKSISLKIFDIIVDDSIAEGFKTINIDDGKEYCKLIKSDYLEREGVDEIGDVPHGKGYSDFRELVPEHLKSLMAKGVLINMNCHEAVVVESDEETDDRHRRYVPDVGDKTLNEGLAKWFTLVGRAVMISNEDGAPPYMIDFTPKKWSLSKAPYRFGFTKPVPNDYNKIQELIKNK